MKIFKNVFTSMLVLFILASCNLLHQNQVQATTGIVPGENSSLLEMIVSSLSLIIAGILVIFGHFGVKNKWASILYWVQKILELVNNKTNRGQAVKNFEIQPDNPNEPRPR